MILYAKFGEHQPLNRQSESYAREGVDLDVSTLADWVGACTASLTPLVELIRRHVFAAERIRDLIGADLRPTRHVGNNRTRFQTRRDNRPLLLIAPAPPTLRAGDYLNSRHRTVANTVACTDASNSPNRCRSARRPSPERYLVRLRAPSSASAPRRHFD